MPRPPRPQFAGAVYHLIVHAVSSEPYFQRPSDRDILFWLLDGVVERFGWECSAYCFMTTHVHLLVETPMPNVSAGMQRLNGLYAQGFNRRYARRGHLVESRYRSVLVEDDRQLLAAARYIALNPLAAGACRNPEDWLWSSYRATAGLAPSPRLLRDDALLGLLADDRALARLEWRSVLAAAIARGEHLKPRNDRPTPTGVDGPSHFRPRV
jgi:putative transposase